MRALICDADMVVTGSSLVTTPGWLHITSSLVAYAALSGITGLLSRDDLLLIREVFRARKSRGLELEVG